MQFMLNLSFPQKNRKITESGSEASTKYTQRGTEMYRKIAEYLRITVDGKNGTTLHFSLPISLWRMFWKSLKNGHPE